MNRCWMRFRDFGFV